MTVILMLSPFSFTAEDGGIIDLVAHDVFVLLGKATQNSDVEKATVRMSYMELYREELRDLLELHTTHKELHIREDDQGNTGHLKNSFTLLNVIYTAYN